MESVRTFKYLGSVVNKDDRVDDEQREKAQQGKKVVVTLKAVTRNRKVTNETKKYLPYLQVYKTDFLA